MPLIAISLQAMVFFFTTLLIDRERPDVEKLDDSPPTSSFPSGHTGAATGLYFTLALMALRIRNPALRRVVVGVCVAIPLLVASARLYRGMHHVSDVAGGHRQRRRSRRCSRGAGCGASDGREDQTRA